MHQALNVREIGLQVFLLHPVVVKVGVAGLGRSERCPEKPVVGAFRQVLTPDQTARPSGAPSSRVAARTPLRHAGITGGEAALSYYSASTLSSINRALQSRRHDVRLPCGCFHRAPAP